MYAERIRTESLKNHVRIGSAPSLIVIKQRIKSGTSGQIERSTQINWRGTLCHSFETPKTQWWILTPKKSTFFGFILIAVRPDKNNQCQLIFRSLIFSNQSPIISSQKLPSNGFQEKQRISFFPENFKSGDWPYWIIRNETEKNKSQKENCSCLKTKMIFLNLICSE